MAYIAKKKMEKWRIFNQGLFSFYNIVKHIFLAYIA